MPRWTNESKYDREIALAAARERVPLALAKAVIAHESAFNPRAHRAESPRASLPPTKDHPDGGDESLGLTQVLVRTARGMGFTGPKEQLYDVPTNLRLGMKYLGWALRHATSNGYGIPSALSIYNGGPSAERKGDGKRKGSTVEAPFINQDYVDTVSRTVAYFAAQGAPAALTSQPAPQPGGAAPGESWDKTGIGPALLIVATLIASLQVAEWLLEQQRDESGRAVA